MNTEPIAPPLTDLDALSSLKQEHEQALNALSSIQEEFQKTKDGANERIFYLTLTCIVLIDCLVLPNQHWIVISFVCLIESAAILCMAERCGVERFIHWIDWVKASIFQMLEKRRGQEKGQKNT